MEVAVFHLLEVYVCKNKTAQDKEEVDAKLTRLEETRHDVEIDGQAIREMEQKDPERGDEAQTRQASDIAGVA
jgi:hypothetical protein